MAGHLRLLQVRLVRPFSFPPGKQIMKMTLAVTASFLFGFHSFAQIGLANQGTNLIPGGQPEVSPAIFRPLTEGEILDAEEAVSSLQVTHDDVKDITWYDTAHNDAATSIRLYMGRFPTGNAVLRLKMRYVGRDWIFTERFLIKADKDHITIVPEDQMDRDVADGHVSETYDEPAKNNLTAVERILGSQDCTVRFDGKTVYSDYQITDYDRNQMRKMVLAYRYFSLDAQLREKWSQEEASLQASIVASNNAVAKELLRKNREQLQENAVKMYHALAAC
jgi:hypothetical protein